jgi:16S rRNA (adenine1518-N6/adenine1519-N6)-dimethyltransferase
MRRRSEREPLHQKKSLSQVFLKVDWPVEKMVSLLRQLNVSHVVEIGPGAGVLTRALLGAGMHVTAIEKDPRFAAHLETQRELWESLTSGKLTVVNEDILRSDLTQWLGNHNGVKALVGNIPYHISSQIVQLGLNHLRDLAAILLMTQLEFAARVAAESNTKDYGSLSVFAQLRAQVTLEFKVERSCFEPVPKVDSAVMMLRPRQAKLSEELLSQTEQVTRMVFTQRRKKLSNSLQSLMIGKKAANCPIDLNRRADALAPSEYVELANWLFSDA